MGGEAPRQSNDGPEAFKSIITRFPLLQAPAKRVEVTQQMIQDAMTDLIALPRQGLAEHHRSTTPTIY